MPKKYTVKVNYEAIVDAIDNHKVYRGNNTSFCLDMGFENRTSWVSDLKRGRNLPSPKEAAKLCSLLKKTPEEILLHQGETEEQTAKCQKDIALVRDLLDQQRTKKAPTEISEREDLCPTAERIVDILKVAPQAELDKILGYVEFLQSKWGEKK